jgi:hypothetical protein
MLAIAAMTVMMAPPAMPMMRVSNIDDYLRAGYRNQWHQECEGENSKRNLLHTHGKLPLLINRVAIFVTRSSVQENNPIQVALNWIGLCAPQPFNKPNTD